MPDPAALDARAAALRELAEDVEVVVDRVRATAGAPGWSCPHADDVRAALMAERARAVTAAAELRAEAHAAALAAQREREDRAEAERARLLAERRSFTP